MNREKKDCRWPCQLLFRTAISLTHLCLYRNSCVDSESALPQSDQTPAIAEDMILADVRQRLAAAEKRCSHYFELFKKYRLRWLEENQRADILGKYAPPDVDPYSPAQIQWDAPSPCPGENANSILWSANWDKGRQMIGKLWNRSSDLSIMWRQSFSFPPIHTKFRVVFKAMTMAYQQHNEIKEA